jgi:transcription elongation factor S-II
LSATNSHIILDIPLGEHLQPDEGTAATDDSKRVASIKTLSTVLEKNGVKKIDVHALERSIFNISIIEAKKRHVTPHWGCKMFQYIYTTKVRHITGNLIPGSYIENKYLLNEVQKGKLQVEEIAALSPYSMNNDLWKDYIHRQQQREKSQLEGNKAMATDQFLCGRCHKRECTYYEMQTRSADEPMTIFITCLNCGKHWRQ